MRDSNSRHSPCKGDALPTELITLGIFTIYKDIVKYLGKKRMLYKSTLFNMAERTGLEPATPGVTGRYSNQLNYRSKVTRLFRLVYKTYSLIKVVGDERFELPTFAL